MCRWMISPPWRIWTLSRELWVMDHLWKPRKTSCLLDADRRSLCLGQLKRMNGPERTLDSLRIQSPKSIGTGQGRSLLLNPLLGVHEIWVGSNVVILALTCLTVLHRMIMFPSHRSPRSHMHIHWGCAASVALVYFVGQFVPYTSKVGKVQANPRDDLDKCACGAISSVPYGLQS